MNTNLKTLILERRLRQYDLARRLGLTETRFSRIVNEREEPDAAVKAALAKLLDVPAAHIFPEGGAK